MKQIVNKALFGLVVLFCAHSALGQSTKPARQNVKTPVQNSPPPVQNSPDAVHSSTNNAPSTSEFSTTTKLKNDTKFQFIQAGISYTRVGDNPYDAYPRNPDNSYSPGFHSSLGISQPSYTRISNHIYFNAPLPTLSFSNNPYNTSQSVGIMPAAGYVFLDNDSKIRPFIAGVLDMDIRRFHIKPQTYSGIYMVEGSTSWASEWQVNLRLGAYYQTCERWWLYGEIDAPTGHSLLYHTTRSGYDAKWKVFSNTYDSFLPNVQFGGAYQIR